MKRKISAMRQARFFCGLTLDELGKKTGLELSRLSRIENGFLSPSDYDRKKIAKALKTSEGELFPGGSDARH